MTSPDRRTATEAWALPALRRSTVPTPDDLAARRAAGGTGPWPSGVPDVELIEARYGDVPCVVCQPPAPRGVLLYFHGGGYRLGSAAMFTPFAARLAAATGAGVVVVDYRLAPEHPFPAALHDAASVYEQILGGSDQPPFVIGDSAGAGWPRRWWSRASTRTSSYREGSS